MNIGPIETLSEQSSMGGDNDQYAKSPRPDAIVKLEPKEDKDALFDRVVKNHRDDQLRLQQLVSARS